MTAAFDKDPDEPDGSGEFKSDPLADTVSMNPSPSGGPETSTGVPQLDDPAADGEGTQSIPDVLVPGGGFGWPA